MLALPSSTPWSRTTWTTVHLLEQMSVHLATDAGKELTKKVGLVYQLDIAQVRSLCSRNLM